MGRKNIFNGLLGRQSDPDPRNSGYRDKRPGTEGPSEWSTVE